MVDYIGNGNEDIDLNGIVLVVWKGVRGETILSRKPKVLKSKADAVTERTASVNKGDSGRAFAVGLVVGCQLMVVGFSRLPSASFLEIL